MSAVRIIFDEVAQRWEFTRPTHAASTDLVEDRTGVFLGTDGHGMVVEVVVDVDGIEPLTGPALNVIVDAFGDGIRPVLDGLDLTGGIDIVVDVTPRAGVVAAEDSQVPGEPGTLIARADGGFDVIVGDGIAHVEVSDTGVDVELEGLRRDGLWVRISDSRSGTLLALGPLRQSGPTARASISFGLDVGVDATLLSVTDEPLQPVAPRPQRRRAWIDELLADAEHDRFVHPLRSLRGARQALGAAEAIGDGERRRRAASSVRRSRATLGAGAVLLVAMVAALTWWIVGGDDDPTAAAEFVTTPTVESTALPETTSMSVQEEATAADPAPSIGAQPYGGPADYRVGDEGVVLALDGSTTVTAGDQIVMNALGSVVVPNWVMGPHPGEVEPTDGAEEFARTVCLSAIDVRPSAATFEPPPDTAILVRFRAVDSDESVGAGPVVLSAPIASLSAVPESCRESTIDTDGAFRASMVATREAEQFVITVPDGLAVGRWTVELSVGADAASSNDPIVLHVEAG